MNIPRTLREAFGHYTGNRFFESRSPVFTSQEVSTILIAVFSTAISLIIFAALI